MSVPPQTEQVFFNDDGIYVTNTRLVSSFGTFTMAQITSVRTEQHTTQPDNTLALVLIIAGLFCLFITTVIGIIMMARNKPVTTYAVCVGSASGEQRAIESPDREYIDRIVQAVNQAIVARG